MLIDFLQQLRRWLIVMLLVCAIGLLPKGVLAMDLQQTYLHMLDSNLSYRRATLNYQADLQQLKQSRAALLPTVNLSASGGVVDEYRQQTVAGDGNAVNAQLSPQQQSQQSADNEPIDDNYTDASVELSLSQTLYDGRLSADYRQAKSRALESKVQLDGIRDELIVELADIYFGWLRGQDEFRVANFELQAIDRHRDLTIQRHEQGLGSLTDVYESRSRSNVAQADVTRAKQSLFQFQQQLQTFLHWQEGDIALAALASGFEKKRYTLPDVAQLLASLEKSSVDIQLQKQRLATAKQGLKRQKASYQPTLTLNASSSVNEVYDRALIEEESSRDNRIALQLNVPLFAGLGNKARVKEARLRFEAEQVQLQSVRQQQSSRVAELFAAVESDLERMQILFQAFENSHKALLLREQGYLEGISSNLDLLDAYRDKYRSESSWLSSRYDYLRSLLELLTVVANDPSDYIVKLSQFMQASPLVAVGIDRAEIGHAVSNAVSNTVEVGERSENNALKVQSHSSQGSKSARPELEKQFLLVMRQLQRWEEAWEQQDIERYFAHYSEQFQPPAGMTLQQWKNDRERHIAAADNIDLVLSDRVLSFNAEAQTIEQVFTQQYSSVAYQDLVKKKVVFQQDLKGVWKIIAESVRPLRKKGGE